MESTNQESNTHTDTTQSPVPIRDSPKKLLLVLCIVIGVAFLLGVSTYLIFSKQNSDSNNFPFQITTQKQAPEKGCGNNLCEGDETYDLCPSDCILPNSIEPTLKRILITESDLPESPAPNKEPWVKQIDSKIDQTYVGFAPQDIKPYTGWQVTYYPLPHDYLAWIEQMILVYPPDKIRDIFNSIDVGLASFQKAESLLKIEELPSPNTGERSRAFGTVFQGQSRYMIIFYKKGFYETLTLKGTAFEYKVLEDIARKAADKIQ